MDLPGKPTVSASASVPSPVLSPLLRLLASSAPAARWQSASPAGVLCYWGVTGLKRILGADDALDCFGVHGVGGIVGALLTGVFAISEYGGTPAYQGYKAAQMINQVQGIAVVIIYDAIVVADPAQGHRCGHRAPRLSKRWSAKASISLCTARSFRSP